MNRITISLGGLAITCRLHFPETAAYFDAFTVASDPQAISVSLTEMDLLEWEKDGATPGAQLEYSYLTGVCSDALLTLDRCAFHAVALRHGDRAWLIAAAPGVGKTTQLLTLQRLFPGEFFAICGDRPILRLTDEQGVFVHPSPWNGKEGFGGAEGAPLAGIILLERGEENSVAPLSKSAAAPHVYLSVIQTGESEEGIRRAAAFTEELLKRVPVWKMVSRDIEDSARVLYQTLMEGSGCE